MADIELVIKIDEKVKRAFDYAKSNDFKDGYYDHGGLIGKAIKNGTPLPKGHGRLIDADAFERRCMFDSSIEDMQDVIYALRDYKPIIESDKGDKK